MSTQPITSYSLCIDLPPEPICETVTAPKSDPSEPPKPRTTFEPAPELEAVQDGRALIYRGHSGDDVRWIQQRLFDHGARIKVDGKFGAETEAALRAFQALRGVESDGLVGPETLREFELV